MINHVVMMGRLTDEPDVRTTQSGTSYCRFCIAVDRPYKSGDEKKTDFFNCVAWRQTADFIGNHFVKGQLIALTGSLRTGSFENASGDTVKTVDINVESVSFTGDKRNETTPTAERKPTQIRPRQNRARTDQTPTETVEDIIADEDLPF